MRSSKSRSRSKANRPRTLGNIINRVFDSSGPEGKVRGTPQQIIEKYQMLAGDAQRSNDRVAAENFSQHAEHYTRMLAEAQREMAAEQEQRQQSQPGPQNGNGYGGNRNDRNERSDYRAERLDQGDSDQPYVGGFVGDGDTGLVDLPESPRPQQQPRRDENRRDPRPEGQPRRQENRRDDRPREERTRDDRQRDDRPREDRAREDRPRADTPRVDTPRADTPREDRPRDNRRDQQPRSETPADQPVAAAHSVQAPLRFESPAQLVAQVEQAATAAPKPRTPKPEGDAPKTTRAPRARKPKVEGASESVE
ncbi:DUF4167 domain-containing protein [Cypionkella sp.]|uniref:DUF4167 domain-containing protein n=1 Tax=Cypionkella sp. TaxID=2811411 RepID=UPI00375112EE